MMENINFQQPNLYQQQQQQNIALGHYKSNPIQTQQSVVQPLQQNQLQQPLIQNGNNLQQQQVYQAFQLPSNRSPNGTNNVNNSQFNGNNTTIEPQQQDQSGMFNSSIQQQYQPNNSAMPTPPHLTASNGLNSHPYSPIQHLQSPAVQALQSHSPLSPQPGTPVPSINNNLNGNNTSNSPNQQYNNTNNTNGTNNNISFTSNNLIDDFNQQQQQQQQISGEQNNSPNNIYKNKSIPTSNEVRMALHHLSEEIRSRSKRFNMVPMRRQAFYQGIISLAPQILTMPKLIKGQYVSNSGKLYIIDNNNPLLRPNLGEQLAPTTLFGAKLVPVELYEHFIDYILNALLKCSFFTQEEYNLCIEKVHPNVPSSVIQAGNQQQYLLQQQALQQQQAQQSPQNNNLQPVPSTSPQVNNDMNNQSVPSTSPQTMTNQQQQPTQPTQQQMFQQPPPPLLPQQPIAQQIQQPIQQNIQQVQQPVQQTQQIQQQNIQQVQQPAQPTQQNIQQFQQPVYNQNNNVNNQQTINIQQPMQNQQIYQQQFQQPNLNIQQTIPQQQFQTLPQQQFQNALNNNFNLNTNFNLNNNGFKII